MSNSRGLIRSMLVIGSAQAASIVISILRIKVLAILLGPAGIGLLSIYNSLKDTVSQGAGLGMASSSIREIAGARGEERTLSRVRQVLFVAHLMLGLMSLVIVWLLRNQISQWLFGDTSHALEVGLVGIAILLTLLSSAQTALLQGLRRINDLSRVTILGALAGTTAGLGAVWLLGEAGLIWFLLIQPLAAVLVALHFTRLLPRPAVTRLTLREMWWVFRPMTSLGAAFMFAQLATTATLLLVRGRISQELGIEAAGYFAAAWGIAMTYVGFMLGAMGADYFPRLTEIIKDRAAAVRLMNDQAQLALAIGGPIMLLLIGLGPWVISILYSSAFGEAVTILQWQTLGNIIRLGSWPLGFAIVALANGKTFVVQSFIWNGVFLALVWPMLPLFGILATGPAFVIASFIHFAFVLVVVRHIVGFRWERLSLIMLGLHTVLGVALLGLALTAPPLFAALAAPVLSLTTGLFGLRVVLMKIGPEGHLAARLYGFFANIRWPIRSTS